MAFGDCTGLPSTRLVPEYTAVLTWVGGVGQHVFLPVDPDSSRTAAGSRWHGDVMAASAHAVRHCAGYVVRGLDVADAQAQA